MIFEKNTPESFQMTLESIERYQDLAEREKEMIHKALRLLQKIENSPEALKYYPKEHIPLYDYRRLLYHNISEFLDQVFSWDKEIDVGCDEIW